MRRVIRNMLVYPKEPTILETHVKRLRPPAEESRPSKRINIIWDKLAKDTNEQRENTKCS